MVVNPPLFTKVKTPSCEEKVPAASGYALVKFFEPGHQFERILNENFAWLSHWAYKKIQIGEVDCSLYKSICDQYCVDENPTIIMFKDGQVLDYFKRQQRSYEISAFTQFLRARGVNLAMKDKKYGHLFAPGFDFRA